MALVSKRLDEQIKLTANLLNSAAGSCFTIGVVGPLVAVAINLGDAATKVGMPALVINAAIWSYAGFAPTCLCEIVIAEAERMRSDVLFVTVILPCAVMVIGWIAYKLHDRWVDREIAREKAEARLNG